MLIVRNAAQAAFLTAFVYNIRKCTTLNPSCQSRRESAMLRIIYMGTPQFAVPPLEALITGSKPGLVLPEGYEIVTVITRPDKPVGRGKEIVYSPVKEVVLSQGIPVWQPGSLKRPENIEA